MPDALQEANLSSETFRKWDLLARFIMLAYAGLIAGGCWLLFSGINTLVSRARGPADFILSPFPIFFWTPALFAGILLSSIPLRWTIEAFLGKDGYRKLVNYSDNKQGFNSERIFRYIVVVMVPIIAMSVFLAWRTYAVITPQGITIQRYFSLSANNYAWRSIHRVLLVKSFSAPNGTIKHQRYYVIETSDGKGLNFHQSLLEVPLAKQREIAEYIANHVGLEIDVIDPFPNR